MASVNRIGTARGAERDVAHQITNFGVGEVTSPETTANRTTNEISGTNFDSQQMTFPFVVNNLMLERRILDFFAKVGIGNVFLSRTRQLDKCNHVQIIRVNDNIRSFFRDTDVHRKSNQLHNWRRCDSPDSV